MAPSVLCPFLEFSNRSSPPELIDPITVQSTHEERGDVDILIVCLAEVGDGLTDSLLCKHKLRVGADRDQVLRDTLRGFIVKF